MSEARREALEQEIHSLKCRWEQKFAWADDYVYMHDTAFANEAEALAEADEYAEVIDVLETALADLNKKEKK